MNIFRVKILLLPLTFCYFQQQFEGVRAAPPAVSQCRSGDRWIKSHDKCLYIGTDVVKIWTEARKECQNLQSDLACLPTNIHNNTLLLSLSPGLRYWVGYHKGSEGSGWINGDPGLETNRFQPSSLSGQQQCGIVMVAGNGINTLLQWSLGDCTVPYRFLCMGDPQAQDAARLSSSKLRTTAASQQQQSYSMQVLRWEQLSNSDSAKQRAYRVGGANVRETAAIDPVHQRDSVLSLAIHDKPDKQVRISPAFTNLLAKSMKRNMSSSSLRLPHGCSRDSPESKLTPLEDSKSEPLGKILGINATFSEATKRETSIVQNDEAILQAVKIDIREEISGPKSSQIKSAVVQSAQDMGHPQMLGQTVQNLDTNVKQSLLTPLLGSHYFMGTARQVSKQSMVHKLHLQPSSYMTNVYDKHQKLLKQHFHKKDITLLRKYSHNMKNAKPQNSKQFCPKCNTAQPDSSNPSLKVSERKKKIRTKQKTPVSQIIHGTQSPNENQAAKQAQTSHILTMNNRRRRSPGHRHSHEVQGHNPTFSNRDCCWIETSDGRLIRTPHRHCGTVGRNSRERDRHTCRRTGLTSRTSTGSNTDTSTHPFSQRMSTLTFDITTTEASITTAKKSASTKLEFHTQSSVSLKVTRASRATNLPGSVKSLRPRATSESATAKSEVVTSSSQGVSAQISPVSPAAVHHTSFRTLHASLPLTALSSGPTGKQSTSSTQSTATTHQPDSSTTTTIAGKVATMMTTSSTTTEDKTSTVSTVSTTDATQHDSQSATTTRHHTTTGHVGSTHTAAAQTGQMTTGTPSSVSPTPLTPKTVVVPSSRVMKDVIDFIKGPECPIQENCISQVLLHPDLPAKVKVALLNSDLIPCPSCDFHLAHSTDNVTLASDRWKHSIERFFSVLNGYLEGAHSHGNQLNNRSLESILHIVDSFLAQVMGNFHAQSDMQRVFSHLEFQIKSVSGREGMRQFQYQDSRQLCHVNQVDFAHIDHDQRGQSHEQAVLVSVVMNTPNYPATLMTGESTEEGVLGSPVMLLSGYVHGQPHSLRHAFQLKLLNDHRKTVYKPRCVFLEENWSLWSTYGCEVEGHLDTTNADDDDNADIDDDDDAIHMVKCGCNHTSNFAILMQIVPLKVSEAHGLALSIITYIGCSITLVTQFMAITVFTCIGSLNCERVCVHRNLCVAIVGAQVTFLAGIEAVQYRLVCSVVAVLLHYWYTAVFVWMLVEGLHLYSKIVRVFGTEKSRMTYYVCFGWGNVM